MTVPREADDEIAALVEHAVYRGWAEFGVQDFYDAAVLTEIHRRLRSVALLEVFLYGTKPCQELR